MKETSHLTHDRIGTKTWPTVTCHMHVLSLARFLRQQNSCSYSDWWFWQFIFYLLFDDVIMCTMLMDSTWTSVCFCVWSRLIEQMQQHALLSPISNAKAGIFTHTHTHSNGWWDRQCWLMRAQCYALKYGVKTHTYTHTPLSGYPNMKQGSSPFFPGIPFDHLAIFFLPLSILIPHIASHGLLYTPLFSPPPILSLSHFLHHGCVNIYQPP